MPPDGILPLFVLLLLSAFGAVLTVCGVAVRSKRNDDESEAAETDSDNVSTAASSGAVSGSGGHAASSESETSLTTDSTTSDDDELSAIAVVTDDTTTAIPTSTHPNTIPEQKNGTKWRPLRKYLLSTWDAIFAHVSEEKRNTFAIELLKALHEEKCDTGKENMTMVVIGVYRNRLDHNEGKLRWDDFAEFLNNSVEGADSQFKEIALLLTYHISYFLAIEPQWVSNKIESFLEEIDPSVRNVCWTLRVKDLLRDKNKKRKLTEIDPAILIPTIVEILNGKTRLDSESMDLAMSICTENIELVSSFANRIDLPKRLVELIERHRTEENIRAALLVEFSIYINESKADMDGCINSLRPILKAAIKKSNPLPILINATRSMLASENWKDRAAALLGFASVEVPKTKPVSNLETAAPFYNDAHSVVREAAYRVALESFLCRFEGQFSLVIEPNVDCTKSNYALLDMYLRVMEEAVRMLSGQNLPEKQRTIALVNLLEGCYGNSSIVRKHGSRMKQLFVDSLIGPLKRMLGEECTELQANALGLIVESVKCAGKVILNANKAEFLNLISPHITRIILEDKGSFDFREMVENFDSARLGEMIVGSLLPLALAPLPEKDDLKENEYERIKQTKNNVIGLLWDMGDYPGIGLASVSDAFAPCVDEFSQLMVEITNDSRNTFLLLSLVNEIKHQGTIGTIAQRVQCWRGLKEACDGEMNEKLTENILEAVSDDLIDKVNYEVSVLDVEFITEMLEQILEQQIKSGKKMSEECENFLYQLIKNLFKKFGARFCPYFARFGKLVFNDRIDLGLGYLSSISNSLIEKAPDFALLYEREIKDVRNASLSSDSFAPMHNYAYTIRFMAASHRIEWKELAAASIDNLFSMIHTTEVERIRSAALSAIVQILKQCKSIDRDSKLPLLIDCLPIGDWGSANDYLRPYHQESVIDVYSFIVDLIQSKHSVMAKPGVSAKLHPILVKGLDLDFEKGDFGDETTTREGKQLKDRMRAIVDQMSIDKSSPVSLE